MSRFFFNTFYSLSYNLLFLFLSESRQKMKNREINSTSILFTLILLLFFSAGSFSQENHETEEEHTTDKAFELTKNDHAFDRGGLTIGEYMDLNGLPCSLEGEDLNRRYLSKNFLPDIPLTAKDRASNEITEMIRQLQIAMKGDER